jgi:hypothetical protein
MTAEGEQVRPAAQAGQNPVGVTRPGAQQRPAVAGG